MSRTLGAGQTLPTADAPPRLVPAEFIVWPGANTGVLAATVRGIEPLASVVSRQSATCGARVEVRWWIATTSISFSRCSTRSRQCSRRRRSPPDVSTGLEQLHAAVTEAHHRYDAGTIHTYREVGAEASTGESC